MAGMEDNTFRAYASAFRSFTEYFESMQWVDPYLGGSVASDLIRVVSWINHLAVDKGVVRLTVSSYLTGVKQLLSLHAVSSMALGPEKGARHDLVNLALSTVPASGRSRVAYSPEWILEGRRVWPSHVFVAVASIFLLALRQGEFIGNYGGAATQHLLKWFNIVFLRWCGDASGGYVEINGCGRNSEAVYGWVVSEVHLEKVSVPRCIAGDPNENSTLVRRG